MIIKVESTKLHTIADEIQRNCDLLSDTWGEYAEDDIALYAPAIRQLAEDLQQLALLAEGDPE